MTTLSAPNLVDYEVKSKGSAIKDDLYDQVLDIEVYNEAHIPDMAVIRLDLSDGLTRAPE